MTKLLKSAASVFALSAVALGPAVALTFLSTTAATAEKGGNGNGRSNGNSRPERSGNGNGNSSENASLQASNNNGRGAIARELKGLNAAHANQSALENASPTSMPGKLYAFQQASLAASQVDAQVVEKADLYAALQNMTEERFYELNPDLDYASTLAMAGADYQAALDVQSNAAADTQQTLSTLTEGRVLSEAAMAELRLMLGL